MTNDVWRAYFYAKVQSEVSVEMPAEDKDEADGDVVDRLNLFLNGTRNDAHQWQETVWRLGSRGGLRILPFSFMRQEILQP